MNSETFEFHFTHSRSAYSICVERFLMEDRTHLWTIVKHPKTVSQVFNFYETATPDKLLWHPMNDKRDELISSLEKSLISKLKALKKKGKVQSRIVIGE